MAPGARSRIFVELANVAGPAGEAQVAVSSDADAVRVDPDSARRTVTLDATGVGDAYITVALALGDGLTLQKRVRLGARSNEPPVYRLSRLTIPPGGSLTVDDALLSDFVPGTGSATLSSSAAGRLDLAGILRSLDRYPYGCAEQTTSRALPLLYLSSVASSIGVAEEEEISPRIDKAVRRVLTYQSSQGSFGLWGPGSGDLWLDAYVTDFLGRAKTAGRNVPDGSFKLPLSNLKAVLAYHDDSSNGGTDTAYALYVLARHGRAAIGDLRYYSGDKLDSLASPLAKAQIGAVLALYGDRNRAEAVFRAAARTR